MTSRKERTAVGDEGDDVVDDPKETMGFPSLLTIIDDGNFDGDVSWGGLGAGEADVLGIIADDFAFWEAVGVVSESRGKGQLSIGTEWPSPI